jgi:CheY-like chemotaxis protein
MPEGGTITVRSRRCEEGALIEVEDSGMGMSEEVRVRCLEPFFSTKGEKGTGLGLSMVFGIIKRHNGQLDLQSEIGRGTTFSIKLPMTAEQNANVVEEVRPWSPIRVLVVDDEPVTRDVVSRFLRMDGHEVVAVTNGADALAAFHENPFSLIVTDQGMPGMSGLQLAATVKEMRPDVPIILLTGFGHPGQQSGETPDVVDVVISKPVPQRTLRKAIAQAVRVCGEKSETQLTMAA